MVVGIPGSGKSALILWWCKEMNLPTLMFSADTGPHTTLTRLLATTLDISRDAIVADLDDDEIGVQMEHEYSLALKDSKIQFCFDGSLSVKDIDQELNAYVEIYDAYPEVIVVDNLINVEDTRDHEGQSGILSELHYLTRVTGATVFVLHHASEAGGLDPTRAPPRSAVQNKVTHYPELVLSVAVDSETGRFQIAKVKVRNGKQDPSALRPYELYADLDKTTFHAENPDRYRGWTPSSWAADND